MAEHADEDSSAGSERLGDARPLRDVDMRPNPRSVRMTRWPRHHVSARQNIARRDTAPPIGGSGPRSFPAGASTASRTVRLRQAASCGSPPPPRARRRNDDLIRIGDGSHSMGDDDYRFACAQGSDRSLDKRLVLEVKQGGRLVEGTTRRVFQKGPRNGGADAPRPRERRRSRPASCRTHRGSFSMNSRQCAVLAASATSSSSSFAAESDVVRDRVVEKRSRPGRLWRRARATIPRRTRRCRLPEQRILPLSGSQNFAASWAQVDLPEPLGPTRAVTFLPARRS